jgi:hypothetical protein
LCDGRTALNAVKDIGGRIENEVIVGNSQVFVGTLALDSRPLKFAAWSNPGHKLYSDKTQQIGDTVKRLMNWKSGS